MTTRYTREQPLQEPQEAAEGPQAPQEPAAAPVDTIPGTYAPGAADDPDDVTGG